MIGICTDSNSQLPETLATRYGVEVVPVTVTVDEHDYLEGVDLDADTFYEMLVSNPLRRVSTSHPSPGQFAAAYDSLLQRGCNEIVSIHVTATASGALNSARLAARLLPIPVRLVDSGVAGFGVSCCVWAAGEAIAHGANLDDVVRAAESLMPHIGAVFVVGELDFIRTGSDHVFGIPVMTVNKGHLEVVARVNTARDAVEALTSKVIGWGPRLNVAIGLADRSGEELVSALARVVSASPKVLEVVRYRIGPSVGAYAGLGTVGCFMFPAQ